MLTLAKLDCRNVKMAGTKKPVSKTKLRHRLHGQDEQLIHSLPQCVTNFQNRLCDLSDHFTLDFTLQNKEWAPLWHKEGTAHAVHATFTNIKTKKNKRSWITVEFKTLSNLPKSKSFTSLAALSPSALRFLSIILLRSTAALSSALNVHPIFRRLSSDNKRDSGYRRY